MKMWNEKLQRIIVRESNAYFDWIDPGTSVHKRGEKKEPMITLSKFKRFIGICMLMAV